MAYVINPDGTISVVGAKYDSNGNIVLRDYSKLENPKKTSHELYVTDHFLAPRRNSKKKKKVKTKKEVLDDALECVNRLNRLSAKTIKQESTNNVFVLGENAHSGTLYDRNIKVGLVKKGIDKFISKRKRQNRIITNSEYKTILHRLNIECKLYFIEEFAKYKVYCEENGLYQIEEESQTYGDFVSVPSEHPIKQNLKKDKKKKRQNNRKDKHKSSNSGYYASQRYGQSLADIATFSSLKKTTEDSDYVQGRSIYGASRQPKYGYARDRYGRVQERDRLDEDRYNEFSQAQKHNKNFDYSDYDPNDDHDGAYSGWE